MGKLQKEIIEIAPHTWCVSEYKLVNFFILEGKENSLLIDTGCGIGNVQEDALRVTEKPLSIALTHGHFDHCGGIKSFATCFMHADDDTDTTRNHYLNGAQMCRWYIENRVPIRFPGEGHMEALLAQAPTENNHTFFSYTPLEDGSMIDLGDRLVEAIHTPGHSNGSVCFLDKNARILFSGDTVNNSIIIPNKPEGTEKEQRIYLKSLKKLWNRQSEFDQLAIGHDGILVDKKLIQDYIHLEEAILSGDIVGTYEEIGFRKGVVARYEGAELWYRCDQ